MGQTCVNGDTPTVSLRGIAIPTEKLAPLPNTNKLTDAILPLRGQDHCSLCEQGPTNEDSAHDARFKRTVPTRITSSLSDRPIVSLFGGMVAESPPKE